MTRVGQGSILEMDIVQYKGISRHDFKDPAGLAGIDDRTIGVIADYDEILVDCDLAGCEFDCQTVDGRIEANGIT